MTYSVLIVEDEEGIRKYLKEILLENGYSVQSASSGLTALKLIDKVTPDLVMLDLGLPDITGESLLTEIKKNYPEVSIIVLTAKDTVSDIVEGFDLGADDYITKPFTAEELLARVRARLKQNTTKDSKLKVADLIFDKKKLEVKRGENVIHLTPQEYKLLEYLISNKNQVLTRDMILNRIWLYSPDIQTRVVDVYMGYLRKKIDTGYKKKLLHSVRGFGYMIKE